MIARMPKGACGLPGEGEPSPAPVSHALAVGWHRNRLGDVATFSLGAGTTPMFGAPWPNLHQFLSLHETLIRQNPIDAARRLADCGVIASVVGAAHVRSEIDDLAHRLASGLVSMHGASAIVAGMLLRSQSVDVGCLGPLPRNFPPPASRSDGAALMA